MVAVPGLEAPGGARLDHRGDAGAVPVDGGLQAVACGGRDGQAMQLAGDAQGASAEGSRSLRALTKECDSVLAGGRGPGGEGHGSLTDDDGTGGLQMGGMAGGVDGRGAKSAAIGDFNFQVVGSTECGGERSVASHEEHCRSGGVRSVLPRDSMARVVWA